MPEDTAVTTLNSPATSWPKPKGWITLASRALTG